MNSVIRALLLSSVLTLATARLLAAQDRFRRDAMAGIASHGQHEHQPYVTAGDRAYLVGTQDGNFPDQGGHVPGEMGGLWLHPIKLIDGFWAQVTDTTTQQQVTLSKSTDFVTYPFGTRFTYRLVLDSLDIDRFQFSPDGQQGVIVRYEFKNVAAHTRYLTFQFAVKTELTPVWFSDHLGIRDARDTVAWQTANRRFIARDTENAWFAVWGAPASANGEPDVKPQSIPTSGMGVTAASRYTLSVPPHATSTLTFVIAGSATDSTSAVQAYEYLAKHQASLLATKKAHYAALLGRARVTIPDRRLQEVYDWVRINTEWLIREVPGIGRGLGAGLMEYPWWFGTETYSLQALMATGNFDLVKQTLRLLKAQ